VKAAVIGCGSIAAQHLPFLSSSADIALVATCDTSPAAAAFAQQRFGAAAAFTEAGEMLREARPEVVHVLTPPHTHVPVTLACLDAGAHVICEKPAAADAAETERLLDAAQSRGLLLFESRNYLWNDPVQRLSRTVRSGRLGDVLEVDLLLAVDFLSGPFGDENLDGPAVALPAGAVHDFLPHLCYLFLHFAPDAPEPTRVVGELSNRSGNRRAGFDFLDALVFAGAVRGRLRLTADVKPDTFRVTIRGSRATLESDLFNPYFRYEGPPNVGKRTAIGQVKAGLAMAAGGVSVFKDKVMQHGPYHGMPHMLDAMYQAISGKAPPPFTRDEVLASARLVDRIVALAGDAAS
jgi:predicted dehydrogenase